MGLHSGKEGRHERHRRTALAYEIDFGHQHWNCISIGKGQRGKRKHVDRYPQKTRTSDLKGVAETIWFDLTHDLNQCIIYLRIAGAISTHINCAQKASGSGVCGHANGGVKFTYAASPMPDLSPPALFSIAKPNLAPAISKLQEVLPQVETHSLPYNGVSTCHGICFCGRGAPRRGKYTSSCLE